MMVALARAFVGEVLGQLFNTEGALVATDLWYAHASRNTCDD